MRAATSPAWDLSSLALRLAIAFALALTCALAITQHARAGDQLDPTTQEAASPTEARDNAAGDVPPTEAKPENVGRMTAQPTVEAVGHRVSAGETVAPNSDTVATLTEPVVETTAPIAETKEPITEPVVDTVAPVTQPITEPVVDTVAPVTQPIAEPLLDPILDKVVPVTDPIVDTVAPVTEPALESVQPIDTVAPVAPVDERSRTTTGPHPATTPHLVDLVAGPLESARSAAVEAVAARAPIALLDMAVQQPISLISTVLLEAVWDDARPVTELAIGVRGALESQTAHGMGGAGTDFIQLGLLASLLLGLFMCRTMITPSFAPTAGLRLLVPVPPG